MNIKSNLALIRGIFYVDEILTAKSISKAAAKNNIKTANLSSLLNDLERQFGTKFFHRTTSGCVPTIHGEQISHFADKLNALLKEINLWQEKILSENPHLNIYLSPNLEINSIHEFEKINPHITLNFINEEQIADVRISNQPPLSQKMSYTELYVGSEIKQKIWIACNEHNPEALEFFDFIIAKLLPLCDQPKPLS